jgi:uncharacterized protein YqeY
MLLEKIRADQLQARKEGNKTKADILTTLIGEAAMVGKNAGNRNTTDEETTKVITKFLKGVYETLALVTDGRKVTLRAEAQILESYMPTQLTADELKTIILTNFTEKPNVGAVMAYLKANYSGLYDGKVASGLVNTLY